MTTATSYSEKSRFKFLLRHNLRGNLAFTIISVLICIITMPVVYMSGAHYSLIHCIERGDFAELARRFEYGMFPDYAVIVVIQVFLMILAAMAAIISNGYLYSKPMTDFHHSLPSSRSHLFTTRFLAMCGSILAPFYAMSILMMAFQVAFFSRYGCIGAQYFSACLNSLVIVSISVITAYLFCAMICVNVGTALDAFAVIGAVAIMPVVLFASVRSLFETNIYGAYLSYREDFMMAVSPASYPFYIVLCYFENEGNYLLSLLCGIAICAALYLLGIVFYKRRKSELSEQTKSRGKLQTFVKCSAAYCGGLFFYYLFNVTVWYEALIYVMMGAVMVGIVAEIIMSRGIRMLKRNVMWVLGAGFVTCLVFTSLMYDWFGYETYVPAPETVKSVQISYPSHFQTEYYWYGDSPTTITEPEAIAVITESHYQLTQHYKNEDYYWNDYTHPYLNLEYNLTDGRTVYRRYNNVYIPAMMNLARLEASPEFIRQNHLAFRTGEMDDADIWELRANIIDSLLLKNQALMLNESMMNELLEALRTDLLAQSYEEISNPSTQALGYLDISLVTKSGVNDYELEEYLWRQNGTYVKTSRTVLDKSFTNTMVLLENWGETELLKPDLSRVDEMRIVIDGGEYIRYDTSTDATIQVVNESLKSYSNNRDFDFDYERTITREELYATTDYGKPAATTDDVYQWYEPAPVETFGTYSVVVKPDDYEALDALSQNQLLFSRQDVRSGKVGFLFMIQNEQVIAGKFIQLDRLPESMLKEYKIDDILQKVYEYRR